MNKTAVEWLLEKLKSQGLLIGEINNLVAVREAKEIEKQQIKDAYITGMYNAHGETSIDYYEETFKTK